MKLNNDNLAKLMSDVMPNDEICNFSDDEVNMVNGFISDELYDSVYDFIESKNKELNKIIKDDILNKIDSLLEFGMDSAYERWSGKNLNRASFLSLLTNYERIAVRLGNFNYQVENGGLQQWDSNGYSDDIGFMKDFVLSTNFKKKEELLDILENFESIKTAIDKLDIYDDWYSEDYDTRLKTMDFYNKEYYKIKDEWMDYVEQYLIENVPKDYLKKIKEYNISSVRI